MMAGSPADAGEKLQELEDVGIHNVNCWAGAGGYPHEQVMETLALFGAEVMPEFLDPA